MSRISFFIRRLYKDALFSVISIGGFSLSLAVVLILVAFVIAEKEYDKDFPDVENIYRMATSTNGPFIPSKARVLLEDNYPEVEAATNYHISNDEIVYERENFRAEIVHTDESFFRVFSTEFLVGSPEGIFDDPHQAVITESLARRIFGEDDPVGKTVSASHREDLTVVAVVKDFPEKTCLRGELFCSSELKLRFSRSGHNNVYVYLYKMFVRLVPGTDAGRLSGTVSPEIQHFMDWIETEYFLEEFSGIYFNPSVIHDDLNHANLKLIRLLSALSLVILLLSVFNYINLSIAESMKRLHEFGTRQVFGAGRRQLISQFFIEALLKISVSLVLALLLAIPVKNLLTGILGKDIYLDVLFISPLTLITIFLALIVLCSFSAIYISFIILKVQPRLLLIGQTSQRRDSFLSRQLLIILQFSATIILLVGLITISKQVRYVANKDLGYNTESLLRIPVHYRLKDKLPVILQEIRRLPQVKSACFTHGTPGAIYSYSSSDDIREVSTIASDHSFIETFGLDLLYGRNFFPQEQDTVCLINEMLLRNLGGWDSAENRQVFGARVVGVIGDFHHKDLYQQINNLMIVNMMDLSHISIRFNPGDLSEAIAAVENVFDRTASSYSFDYEFYDDWLGTLYKQEQKREEAVRLLSILAILLSCLGLFGLAEYSTKRRTREIGIRKVNGAGSANIMSRLNYDFLKWLVVAAIIACPAAWYIMNRWLSSFAYRTPLAWWIFVLASLVTLAVAFLSISALTWRAANRNPAEVLRYE